MNNKVLSLSKKLINIQSTQNNVHALNNALEEVSNELAQFTIERFNNQGTKSILVYPSKDRPKTFKVLLNGHIDITPGKNSQFSPKIIKGKLYGVGAADMKANLACMITVFKDVANKVKYPLGLQIVTDEEIGGFKGTKYQISKGVKANFVIAGESTDLNIAYKTKGVLWIKVSCKGKTAHSAYVWRGKNAIYQISEFITKISVLYPIPKMEKWVTTINIANIETNNNTYNKVPDYCEVLLDIRYVADDSKKVMTDIKKLMKKGMGYEVVAHEPPVDNPKNNVYIKALRETGKNVLNKEIKLYGANGSSDARHYAYSGSIGIEFGAHGENIGSDNECMDLDSLKKYEIVLKKFLMSL